MKKIEIHIRRALLSALLLLTLCAGCAHAVTRAEMLSALWRALDYPPAPEMRLPPDVPTGHPHAKEIGYAVRYGLIPQNEPFLPDAALNRHDGVRVTLMMMGWGFELSLYESLGALPDFGGSGDSVFFLAAEMTPPAPESILIDGATPLSESAGNALAEWAKKCRSSVRWNRVFSYGGTELILFRQGTARPGEPGEPNEPRDGNPIGARDCEPLYAAAIAVHPSAVDQHIAFAEPFGRPRVVPTDFAAAYDALGVVNGGFFSGARPIGTMLLGGTHAGKPILGRSAIGWNNGDGTFVFGRGGARIGVRVGGAFAEISGFNVAPPPDEASLYTSAVATTSIGTAPDALQLVAVGGVVTERREGSENNHWLPEESVMLVARGASRAKFESAKPGDRLEVLSEWETKSFESCDELIQAGPMLLRNGQFAADAESFKPDITERRHPRTIVGTDGARMIWAVVDGRSALHSRGATIAETRWIAQSLGMTTALNMDGGGSSQIVWRGVLANSPSDGKERPLPYTVLMLPKGAAMTRRDLFDRGEFGLWGYTTEDEGQAAYMDVYDPRQDTGTENR